VGVSRLRRLLAGPGEVPVDVVRTGSGYRLRADPDTIDVRFHALVAQARREDDDARWVALLDAALGLWSGPALCATAATDEVRHRLGQGLEEARLLACEDRLAARLRLGDHRAVLAELTSLVGAHPLRERLVAQQMRALYQGGRPADALLAYRRLRQPLGDELGLDPGDELRRLEAAILRGDRALDPMPPAERRPPGDVPAQLPVAPVLAGRTAELEGLDRLLADSGPAVPAIAIDGFAGVGKTTLVVYWAQRVADRFPDGQLSAPAPRSAASSRRSAPHPTPPRRPVTARALEPGPGRPAPP
jgi:hypothetical protein